jgi:hypothetical protein
MIILFTRRSLVACLVFLVSFGIFWAGYGNENAEAYLFPIIIGLAMVIFSLVSLVREVLALCVEDFQEFPFLRQLPVILVMAVAVFTLEWLGTYSTTFSLLLIVSFWYSAIEDTRTRLIRSLLFAGCFSLVMFLLFSIMLNVQLPRGLLI